MPPKLTELSYEDYLAIKASGIYYEDVQGQKAPTPYIPTTIKEEPSNTKHQWTEDGLTCKAVIKGNTIKIKAVSGYHQGVNQLYKLKDTGDGLIAKSKSYSPYYPSTEITLDYSEADYLYKALQVYFEEQDRMTKLDEESQFCLGN